jgi:hypothetical protein
MTSNIAIVTASFVRDMAADAAMPNATIFDAMIEAQAELGQVTWDCLHPSMALGFFGGQAETSHNRVAVFDLDAADGMDVIKVTNYVLGHTDEMPELKF